MRPLQRSSEGVKQLRGKSRPTSSSFFLVGQPPWIHCRSCLCLVKPHLQLFLFFTPVIRRLCLAIRIKFTLLVWTVASLRLPGQQAALQTFGPRLSDLAGSQWGFTGEADGGLQLVAVGFLLWRAVPQTLGGKLEERKKDRHLHFNQLNNSTGFCWSL